MELLYIAIAALGLAVIIQTLRIRRLVDMGSRIMYVLCYYRERFGVVPQEDINNSVGVDRACLPRRKEDSKS